MLLKPTPTKTEVGASSSASLSKPLPLRFSQITARGFTGAEYRAWVDKIDEVKAYFEPYLTEYNAEPMKIIVNNFVPAIDKLLEYLEESKSSLAIKFRIYNLFKQYFTYGLNNLPVNDVSLEILKKRVIVALSFCKGAPLI